MNSLNCLRFLVAVSSASLLACGGKTIHEEDTAALASTCSELAKQYKEVLESDAALCTVGDDATCTGRRPIWGVVMSGDIIRSYGLSECPVAGSGMPVNPARVTALDAVLAAYKSKGCNLDAGPGCGVPGWTPPVAKCVQSLDGVGRCL